MDWEFLKKIIDLNLGPNDAHFKVRNYFLASYMMYGMNFKDMAYLEKKDIINGRITYRRDKTSKLYDIKIVYSVDVDQVIPWQIDHLYFWQERCIRTVKAVIKSNYFMAV